MDKKELKEEIINLRKEIVETKYRLHTFEASRSAKVARATREVARNPLKALRHPAELFSAFKKTEVEKPDISAINEISRSIPLRIHSNNPLLMYPNIKAACLGTLDEVADVCHAIEMGDMNWINLIDRKIDFCLIKDTSYEANKEIARKWLTEAQNKEIPLIIIKTTDEPIHADLKKADVILDRTKSTSKHAKADMPFVDIHLHNPMHFERNSNGKVALLTNDTATDASLENLQSIGIENDTEQFAAVLVEAETIKDYSAACKLLAFTARGVPVICYGDKTRLPFESRPTYEEAAAFAKELAMDTELRERTSIKQRKQAVLEHSQLQRFEYILTKLSIRLTKSQKISAIVSTMRPKNVIDVIDQFSSQAYENKELILLLHGEGFDETKIKRHMEKTGVDYKLLARGKNTIFGENLNDAVDAASGDFVTKMDDDDYYAENHFSDLLAARRYSRADIVGKWSNWVYLKNKNLTTTWVIEKQESYCHHLPGATFLLERSLLQKVKFGIVQNGIDSELYRRIEARGGTLYSTHRYNFARIRHGAHTYNTSDEKFLARCSPPEFKSFDEKRIKA